MNSGLRRRIEALEERASYDPIVLTFADGSQRTIKGSTKHWRALNAALLETDGVQADGPLSIELNWLDECVQISGPNAQMFCLTKALCSEGEGRDEES